jgi:hypothetical protein
MLDWLEIATGKVDLKVECIVRSRGSRNIPSGWILGGIEHPDTGSVHRRLGRVAESGSGLVAARQRLRPHVRCRTFRRWQAICIFAGQASHRPAWISATVSRMARTLASGMVYCIMWVMDRM